MSSLRSLTLAAIVLVAAVPFARAQPAATPSWTDTPALLAAATAPVDAALRACIKGALPRTISITAVRAPKGATAVSMPLPQLGGRGPTPEERCLVKAVASIQLPELPAGIDRIGIGHTIVAAGAAPPPVDPAFADWKDPAATLRGVFDSKRVAALARCTPRARTVRFVLDLRGTSTRIWMPAWQFHAADGSGTTPPSEQRVKACLTRSIRGWSAPTLPRAMAELEITVAVAPAAP